MDLEAGKSSFYLGKISLTIDGKPAELGLVFETTKTMAGFRLTKGNKKYHSLMIKLGIFEPLTKFVYRIVREKRLFNTRATRNG